MFGYFLVALSVSAFCGAFFFIIAGEPTGAGLLALLTSIVWAIIWQTKKNKK